MSETPNDPRSERSDGSPASEETHQNQAAHDPRRQAPQSNQAPQTSDPGQNDYDPEADWETNLAIPKITDDLGADYPARSDAGATHRSSDDAVPRSEADYPTRSDIPTQVGPTRAAMPPSGQGGNRPSSQQTPRQWSDQGWNNQQGPSGYPNQSASNTSYQNGQAYQNGQYPNPNGADYGQQGYQPQPGQPYSAGNQQGYQQSYGARPGAQQSYQQSAGGYGTNGAPGYGRGAGYTSAQYGAGYAAREEDAYTAQTSSGAPGITTTLVVSIFLGILGLAPASSAASRAKEKGFPTAKYWLTFLGGFVANLVIIGVIAFLLIGRPFSSGSGDSQSSSVPATSSASTQASSTPTTSSSASRSASSSRSSTASRSASSPASSASSARASFPASASQCSDSLAVNSNTSCEFGANVQRAYAASGSSSGSVTVQAQSPVTNQDYSMTCVASSGTVTTCTGGNNAVVYLR